MATTGVLLTLTRWLSMLMIRFYPIYERDGKFDNFYTNVEEIIPC